ncbi:MAG: STAS domain-containing protein [Mariprofundaceae bacterium]|nr:STAS domain-containing protein [Mariprofundaceae bacterium]
MTLQVNREDQILTLRGTVNVHTAPILLKALRDKSTRSFTLNLKDVTALDSAGVATLVEGLRLAREQQQPLALHDVPDCVINAFELTGVSALFSASIH